MIDAVLDTLKAADAEAHERRLNRDMRMKLYERRLRELLDVGGESIAVDRKDYRFARWGDVARAFKSGTAERAWLSFPPGPRVVGISECEEILGVRKPHIARMRENGRMPEPLAELRAGPVFLRHEVEKLGEELAAERERRAARRRQAEERARRRAERSGKSEEAVAA